jgi:heat shock protein HslJ
MSGTAAPSPEPHGQWVLKETVDHGRVTKVSTSLDVYLVFGKNHEIRGFDGCAHFAAGRSASPLQINI